MLNMAWSIQWIVQMYQLLRQNFPWFHTFCCCNNNSSLVCISFWTWFSSLARTGLMILWAIASAWLKATSTEILFLAKSKRHLEELVLSYGASLNNPDSAFQPNLTSLSLIKSLIGSERLLCFLVKKIKIHFRDLYLK